MKKFYFIVNPKAGNGKCLKVWGVIEKRLQAIEAHYEAFITEYPGHAKALAEKVADLCTQGNAVVVAVGGDGTAHEVLNGIKNRPLVSFGFIPGGSGNDFSRGYGTPATPLAALEELLSTARGASILTDCGRLSLNKAKSLLFINNMGAGFDALVSKKANETRMKEVLNRVSLGRLVYVYVLLKELFSYHPNTIQLTIDGKRHIYEQTWFVTVSNQPFYGGGMVIAPSANPIDGLLDITVVHRLSKPKLLVVFMSVFWGKHIYFKEVHTFKGREISVESSAPIHVHADGEYIGSSPGAIIRVLPRAIRLLTNKFSSKDKEIRGEANGYQ